MRALQYVRALPDILCIAWQIKQLNLLLTSVNCIARQSFVPRASHSLMGSPQCVCKTKQLYLLLTSVNCIARRSFVPRASHFLMGNPQCVFKTKQLYLLLTSVNCISQRSFVPRASHSLMRNPQYMCVNLNSILPTCQLYCSTTLRFQGRHIS